MNEVVFTYSTYLLNIFCVPEFVVASEVRVVYEQSSQLYKINVYSSAVLDFVVFYLKEPKLLFCSYNRQGLKSCSSVVSAAFLCASVHLSVLLGQCAPSNYLQCPF